MKVPNRFEKDWLLGVEDTVKAIAVVIVLIPILLLFAIANAWYRFKKWIAR